jgi:hypothetical protein
MRDRSWRRAQRERAIARAKVRASKVGWWGSHDPEKREKWLRKSATTPHPCSSHCCGNPRKWFGHATLQEERANNWEADLREYVESVGHTNCDDEK